MTITANLLKRRFPLLFERFSRAEVEILLDGLARVQPEPGTVLRRCGETADALYLVWEGMLELSMTTRGAGLVLGTIGPGRVAGISAVVEPGPALTTVTVARPSLLLRLDHAGLVVMRATHPRLGGHLLRALSLDLAEWLRCYEDYMTERSQDLSTEELVRLGRKLMGIRADES